MLGRTTVLHSQKLDSWLFLTAVTGHTWLTTFGHQVWHIALPADTIVHFTKVLKCEPRVALDLHSISLTTLHVLACIIEQPSNLTVHVFVELGCRDSWPQVTNDPGVANVSVMIILKYVGSCSYSSLASKTTHASLEEVDIVPSIVSRIDVDLGGLD